MRPLLIHRRKFDIRVFALIVGHADTGLVRGYFYDEGYLRTSSKDFNIEKWDNRLIHLTNDAVQKNSGDYGKFESGNKVSYYLDVSYLIAAYNLNILTAVTLPLSSCPTPTSRSTSRASTSSAISSKTSCRR